MTLAISNELAFDLTRLERYLTQHIAGFTGPIGLEKFAGGQSNPTFLLTSANARYVLRKKPEGKLLKSAHAVDREFKVMSALVDTSIPVAKPIHLCLDESVIGVAFYLMEFVEGKVFWQPALSELTASQRSEIYNRMNQLMVDLHRIDIDQVGLSDYGRPGNYFERQFTRWQMQYRASELGVIPAMETIMDWLATHMPPDDGQIALVHGDFRLDNLLFDRESLDILALVDWELSTLGHPYADLAYQCMQWRMPADGPLPGLGGLDRQALGIPTEQEYVELYCRRRGIAPIAHWEFYLIFSFFRFAAILQGVKKRAVDGNASSTKALELGEYVTVLAELAAELID